jgi:hypothetical protein
VQLTVDAEHDRDDLTVLVDGPRQIVPAAADLDVGFVDEPAIIGQAPARPGGFDELIGKTLHPPVDPHMINSDAASGEQLLHVPVGKSLPQVSTDRDGDHLTRKPKPSERGQMASGQASSLTDGPIDPRNGASAVDLFHRRRLKKARKGQIKPGIAPFGRTLLSNPHRS